MTTTTLAKPGHVGAKWVLVDVQGEILGRIATRIATMLMGKHKPTYTPHTDTGDFVVVINAEKVAVTGRKAQQKVYRHHTGFIGSLKTRPYYEMIETHPEEIIELAVRRMLPKSKLGKQMFTKLKVFRGPAHTHAAQKPEPYKT